MGDTPKPRARADLITGNMVDTFMLGNTRIFIYDSAFINNTPEDEARIKRNIERLGREVLTRQALEKAEEEGRN